MAIKMKLLPLSFVSGIFLSTSTVFFSFSSPVSASVLWSWSYSGGGSIGGSGTFLTDKLSSDNSFSILEITGTAENRPIFSLLPTNSFAGNDNLLYELTPQLNINGLGFQILSGNQSLDLLLFNLFDDGTYSLIVFGESFFSDLHFIATRTTVSVPTTPEASSLYVYFVLCAIFGVKFAFSKSKFFD
ncbi:MULTISPECIES: hypothetical protein [unclassified Microcystis]|jgi:hypothetical protein|uniref:hypothetical protein n=2 Tax=unclassified Microcystis TaxID=2643300 RepID=UPI002582F674|nr:MULTISPECIES: hypothetical protein [unclassified Microcystis]MCA2521428.1 hypothetical protein [Microcystis sp. M63BS1]MCA2548321.1 hypothetical protein [Microcystis sp. M53BS1]MCA2558575.1 hypothetical protein [Microcystis sp. M43BS1]MCA2564907.1 hypothetical protein [Microcystis sp. M40BS1]MCA2569412.1 hypothetical protein [Microcystis sp. M44BS1]MCA2577992.1 hypothetical protein [Microcystis sp. M41BS1]MCA2604896.1 hypothetical protein [Microcystis sp. M26BS1]NCR77591.1 hypothetical p